MRSKSVKTSFASVSVKAPEVLEKFYLKNLRGKLNELKQDIPLDLLPFVLLFKKPYPIANWNFRRNDKEVLDKISEKYGVTRGDAFLLLVFHNFPELRDLLNNEDVDLEMLNSILAKKQGE